jgi:hypothetical protein
MVEFALMAPAQANRLTLLDGPRTSVWYYPGSKIIHHQFRTFVHGDELRGVLEAGLDAFKKYGARKWLSDDQGNSALTPEDNQWANDDWTPRVIAAGWKCWAVVMPAKVVGQLSMKRWIKTFEEKGVTVRVFATPEPALAWLESE